MRKFSLIFVIALFALFANTKVSSFDLPTETQGSLNAYSKSGKSLGFSPLKHTKVKTDISGFLARVTVQQEFVNNFNQPIEAIYTFPLSENSAVDKMTMKIGSRLINGKVKKREEARKIYEQAKTEGKTASLLDQERPNVFTQSVANILPNEKIVIEISYVENLKYEDGSYEFVFPMVVGERYSPASVSAKDAAKVSPPVAKTRAGHDISIEVNLDAGVPIENVSSTLHEINTQNFSSNSAKITLRNEKTIPNKDFILKYDVTGKRIEDAILTHRDERGGFFTMMLSPPEDFRVEDVSPKEIVFVLDTSGSMSGFPLETAKAAMKFSLEGLYPNDTFNLITFSDDTKTLFDEPVYATQENIEKAQDFLESTAGGGGTEMMKAVKAALEPSDSKEHIRIVNFMTDGYVSNEAEIINEIQKHRNARVFSLCIGDGVNRYLLSKIAEAGRGEVSFVTLEDDGSEAAQKFHERIRNPLLTDISIDWNGLPVADIYPKRNPDLFDAKPVVINGRFTNAASGTIKLKGKVGGQNYEREIKVELPEVQKEHDVLATLWARKRIDEITHSNFNEEANLTDEAIKEVTQLGLEFRLLTDYTSFVAVEEIVRTEGGESLKVEVPVERVSGRSDDTPFRRLEVRTSLQGPPTVGTGSGSGRGSGSGGGVGRGYAPPPPPPGKPLPRRISGGVVNGKATSLPAPSLPTAAKTASIKGSVTVAVTIDERGNVISATPTSGHPLLRTNAASAAKQAKFAPTMISGKPVKVSGVIVYNFGDNGATVSNSTPPSPPTFPKPKGPTVGIKILSKPSPGVTNSARQSNIHGAIRLKVTFLANGRIGGVSVVSGLPHGLTQKAIEAARKIKFTPPMRNGVPYSVKKTVVYKYQNGFTQSDINSTNDSTDIEEKIDQSSNNRLKQKLHFWVYDLVTRLQYSKAKTTENESKFIENNKAKLQIHLSKDSADTIDKLRELGFEKSAVKEKYILIGEIDVGRIAKLAEVDGVRFVLPSVR